MLAKYGLDECIVYGWFKPAALIMGWLLHAFHSLVGSYGIAIILLTVLVRACMFPVGRQQAKNAKKMQELTPEIKKIKEKYPTDTEKQAKAQQELFRKHNYNPVAGCLPMFLQLPIFIGLYRALSVDIELRQTPLIPGLEWCSNLAAPDMLFRWAESNSVRCGHRLHRMARALLQHSAGHLIMLLPATPKVIHGRRRPTNNRRCSRR